MIREYIRLILEGRHDFERVTQDIPKRLRDGHCKYGMRKAWEL